MKRYGRNCQIGEFIETFTGRNGSMGFRTGENYRVTVEVFELNWYERLLRRPKIYVTCIAGMFPDDMSRGVVCPYRDWRAFIANWEPVELISKFEYLNTLNNEKIQNN
jgi:hypothetical protein